LKIEERKLISKSIQKTVIRRKRSKKQDSKIDNALANQNQRQIDKNLEVMQTFVRNPHSPLKKTAPAHDVSAMFIRRILILKNDFLS